MTNKNFVKLDEDGKFTYAEKSLRIGNRWIVNPKDSDYIAEGYLPFTDSKPTTEDGYYAVATQYADIVDGVAVRRYEVKAQTYTMDDYNQALEDYLTSVREERGYTTREPSDYANSSVARWKQDAEDWIAFRDAVMMYGLNIINTYEATGEAPSLAEFKANLPTIEWSAE